MSDMTWTQQRPTEPGWYWYRAPGTAGLGKVTIAGQFDPGLGIGVFVITEETWRSMWYAGPLEMPAFQERT